jgi:hypothetical protein
MAMSSVTVVGNSVLLGRYKPGFNTPHTIINRPRYRYNLPKIELRQDSRRKK